MIEVKNLSKFYGTKQALDRLSFEVRDGEVLGFLGPNGAGKSTAMKIITCFLSPTDGTVTVDGLDVVNDSLEVRKKIGYLPEHPPIYLDMTVKDYLEFAARIKGVPRVKVRTNVDRVVEQCNLRKYYRSSCSSLSKGFRQRVGIAQAMVHEPKFLILDEPTIGLDPIQIVEIRELIKEFGKAHTVILSTHILPEVDVTCERVIIINDGRVVTEDSTSNLRRKMPGAGELILEIQGAASGIESKIKAIDGVGSVSRLQGTEDTSTLSVVAKKKRDLGPDVARLVVNEGLDLLELKHSSMTLEEIFVKITMT